MIHSNEQQFTNSSVELTLLQEKLFDTINEICDVAKSASEKIKTRNRKVNTKNQLVLSSISESVIVTDINGVIVECNSSAENLLGCLHNALLGRNIYDMIQPDFTHIKKCNNKIMKVSIISHELDDQKLFIIKA